MKKILALLAVVLLVLVGGFAIWLYQWDLNRYLPQITAQLEKVTGNPVEVRSLHWKWQNGLVIGLDQLAVYNGAGGTAAPQLSVETAALSIRLAPLLRRRVEIAQIKLTRPQIQLVRTAQGEVQVAGIAPPKKEAPAAKGSVSDLMAGMSNLLIEGIIISDGSLAYTDLSGPAPRRLNIQHVDIAVKNISIQRPVSFLFSMALLSPTKNVEGKGQIAWNPSAGQMELKFLDINTDLNAIRIEDLVLLAPEIKEAGLTGPITGDLGLSMKDFQFAGDGLRKANLDLELKNADIGLDFMKGPIENLDFDASGDLDTIRIKTLKADLAGGSLESSGNIYQYRYPGATSELRMQMLALELDRILPPPKKMQPQLHGKLSLGFEGKARGFSWPEISQTLSGQGEVILTDGLLANLNVLRLILDSLQKIPGVAEAVRASVPEQYFDTLNQPYTLLEPIEIRTQIMNGYFEVQNVRIASHGFELYLSGQVQLSGGVNGIGSLVLDPYLSESLRRNAVDFQYITDPYGRVFLPLKVFGSIQNIRVLPDMEYLFNKVVRVKGQEILKELLAS